MQDLDIGAIITAVLLVAGSAIALIAAIGLLRLPDLLTRMHASSKAGTAGSGLMLLAAAAHSGELAIWLKALAAIGFFMLTAPLAAHLLAKAGFRSGQKLTEDDNVRNN